jgi:1,2-diacylglycerol 3-beta-glucosyltransferase
VTAVAILFVVLGGVLAVWALYLFALVVAALFYSRVPQPSSGREDVVVLVPAHDEESTVAACVESLRGQAYPSERYEVVVVADNCTDATAKVAAEAGATVLARTEPEKRGKGYALEWAFERILAREAPPAAVVVVDSDSRADPALLSTLVGHLESGADAVQGESLLWDDGSPEQALRAGAFMLVNRARPSGRAVLGLPSGLAGNGMLFSRALLTEHPWNSFSSTEDVEYGIRLRIEGIDPVYARGAIVWSPTAPHRQAAELQQLRWEGGKLHLARTFIPGLLARAVKERRPGLVDAAFELSVPPLGYLAAAASAVTVAGVALATLDGLPGWAVTPAAVALLAIPAYVLVGLKASDAPSSAYRALIRAPEFVIRKAARAHRLLGFRPDSWVRTERR